MREHINNKKYPYIEYLLEQGCLLKIDNAPRNRLSVYMDSDDAVRCDGHLPDVIGDFDDALRRYYRYHKAEWGLAIKGFFWRTLLRIHFNWYLNRGISPGEDFLKERSNSLLWIKKENGIYRIFWEAEVDMVRPPKTKPLLPGNSVLRTDRANSLEECLARKLC